MNFRQLLICCGAASLIVAMCAAQALAQDMTVYTTIARVTEDAPNETVGRSLTLFHAGKVYDFMEDAGELVVLDQRAASFVILNENDTATRVEFDELNQFLKVADSETTSYIAELAQQNDASARQAQGWLQFQLKPQFQEESGSGSLIKLGSPMMKYEVATAPAPDAQRVQQYLAYADWAARLNFVLHPGSTFPAPRLALNQALRQKAVLPVSVTLTKNSAAPITLRADHKFQWELQQAEKAHIHKWERLLESKQLRWVSFHEYQQRLLADAQRGKQKLLGIGRIAAERLQARLAPPDSADRKRPIPPGRQWPKMPAVNGPGFEAGIGIFREAIMQSTRQVSLAAAAAFGLFGICAGADRPTPAAALQASPAASADPVASGNQLQLGRRRIGQADAAGSTSQALVAEAPPVPIDPEAPSTDAAATPPAGTPSQVALPRIPFMAPPGASAIHERLRAKRLARVQQMRQQAQQNGDTQGVERAQYLEGMVNELHNKGLFNFGQKVMSAMQQGKLQGLTGGASDSAPESGSAEMPDTDLGTASPLPDIDLGQPAPVPTDGATENPKSIPAVEDGPQLPPSETPLDGGDAPPAK